MQGTNASLVVAHPALPSSAPTLLSAVVWCQSRHWVLPETHQLLERSQRHSRQNLVFESLILSHPRLAFLQDHQASAPANATSEYSLWRVNAEINSSEAETYLLFSQHQGHLATVVQHASYDVEGLLQ